MELLTELEERVESLEAKHVEEQGEDADSEEWKDLLKRVETLEALQRQHRNQPPKKRLATVNTRCDELRLRMWSLERDVRSLLCDVNKLKDVAGGRLAVLSAAVQKTVEVPDAVENIAETILMSSNASTDAEPCFCIDFDGESSDVSSASDAADDAMNQEPNSSATILGEKMLKYSGIDLCVRTLSAFAEEEKVGYRGVRDIFDKSRSMRDVEFYLPNAADTGAVKAAGGDAVHFVGADAFDGEPDIEVAGGGAARAFAERGVGLSLESGTWGSGEGVGARRAGQACAGVARGSSVDAAAALGVDANVVAAEFAHASSADVVAAESTHVLRPIEMREASSPTILIEAEITLDDDDIQTIKVRAADCCKEVSQNFVHEYSLRAWFVDPLTMWLEFWQKEFTIEQAEADAQKFPVKLTGDLRKIREQFSNNVVAAASALALVSMVPSHVQEITKYPWWDGKKTVGIYVELEGLDAVPDDRIKVEEGEKKVSLAIEAIGIPPKTAKFSINNSQQGYHRRGTHKEDGEERRCLEVEEEEGGGLVGTPRHEEFLGRQERG